MELKSRKGLMNINNAGTVILLVGLVFVVLSTVVFIGEQYGDVATENSTAENVTKDLNQRVDDNTSIAGIILTVTLVVILLTVIIGVFAGLMKQGV